jgi:hypothetical protein
MTKKSNDQAPDVPAPRFAATDPCPEGCISDHAGGDELHELRLTTGPELWAIGEWIGREADRLAAS